MLVACQGVASLYLDTFHIHYPGLAFVGLACKVVPFPLFDAQAKAVARMLSGEVALPPCEVMQEEVQNEALKGARGSCGGSGKGGGGKSGSGGNGSGSGKGGGGRDGSSGDEGRLKARSLHDLGMAQWDLIRRLYEFARLPVPHSRLALLRRVHKEVGARRRELPLTYRASVYTLHYEEDDPAGGWWQVEHPTHPLGEGETRVIRRKVEDALADGAGLKLDHCRPQKALRPA